MNDRKNLTPVRHAVVGIGASIFGEHRKGAELPEFELVGGSDVDPARGRPLAEALGVPFFTDHKEMLKAVQPEVVVITTPHPFHAPIAIDALNAGCHVLIEKPVALRVSEADAVIEAARRNGRLAAINFQQRCRGDMRTIARLLAEEQLGRVQAFEITMTWPRTKTYYDSGTWRGTWVGEGGGVIMNQAPHQLDLTCHLLGLPQSVFAYTPTTLQTMETEDTVHAVLRWPGGATGFLHITTAEAGRAERWEIAGTRGSVTLIDGQLTFKRMAEDFREVIAHSSQKMPHIIPEELPVTLEPGDGLHPDIYRNLYDAIRNGAPLVASISSALPSLELANALILSGHTGREVQLPVDRAAYEALFAELARGSKFKGW
ncbi:MAG TPA: Gfo/Idh/MocA family oxidoreductase [Devosiaceae bacterium]|jgi:predicted dehydrogenase